jgi:hypothetical protein
VLIDYVLTVAVSIAGWRGGHHVGAYLNGTSAVSSYPWVCVRHMLGNLSRHRESGGSSPSDLLLHLQPAGVAGRGRLALPHWQHWSGHHGAPVASTNQTLGLFLLLTAFSNGCTAMTGVEAVFETACPLSSA